jgi:hypothetical protein
MKVAVVTVQLLSCPGGNTEELCYACNTQQQDLAKQL